MRLLTDLQSGHFDPGFRCPADGGGMLWPSIRRMSLRVAGKWPGLSGWTLGGWEALNEDLGGRVMDVQVRNLSWLCVWQFQPKKY